MIYFSMGYWVIGLALIVSALGAACGLACIRQSTKSVTARFRVVWLFVASGSIGGVGTGLATFVSLLGFEVKGSQLRYDPASISVAAGLAALTTFIALLMVGKRLHWARLVAGSVIMAAGLGIVQLMVLSAVRVQGTTEHNSVSMIAVFVLALVISALTLWFSLTVTSVPVLLTGSLIYGILVTGMHYAGLTGLDAHIDQSAPLPKGADLFDFFVPFFVIGSLSLAIPITAILVAPDRREARQPTTTPDFDMAHSPSLAVASGLRGGVEQGEQFSLGRS
ncbi:hypothetical protein [Nocardia sp. NPDC127526]|uniref:hypothetical protein n=1 Tax=Nocardia sp. NPDC127526 TaxID=3345393 RepID=UPI00363F44FF